MNRERLLRDSQLLLHAKKNPFVRYAVIATARIISSLETHLRLKQESSWKHGSEIFVEAFKSTMRRQAARSILFSFSRISISATQPRTALTHPAIRKISSSHHARIQIKPMTTRRTTGPSRSLRYFPQVRNASTTRRHRKLLNIPPAPTPFPGGDPSHALSGKSPYIPTGSSGRSHRPRAMPQVRGDHVVFDPPSSAPNPMHTPPLFLPREDERRRLLLQNQAQPQPAPATAQAETATTSSSELDIPPLTPPTSMVSPVAPPSSLPSALRNKESHTKSYHLGPEEIEEMRRLRTENENFWTRTRLAGHFNCSNLFVGTVCQASDARRRREARQSTLVKKRWGPKRRAARRERYRRKEMWGRDE